LEEAILAALRELFTQPHLLERAVAAARAELADQRPLHEEELAHVEADIRRTEEAIERYLGAFENGTMPEAHCGERVRGLGAKVSALRLRRDELRAAIEGGPTDPFASVDVDAVRREVRRLFDPDGSEPAGRSLYVR